MARRTPDRVFVALGAVAAAAAVLLGAAGAHLFKAQLSPEALTIFHTAWQFHFFHALGLVLVGLVAARRPQSRAVRISGGLMCAGLLLFSGSLYVYVLGDLSLMRRFTPWGGTSFVAAWLALAVGARTAPDETP